MAAMRVFLTPPGRNFLYDDKLVKMDFNVNVFERPLGYHRRRSLAIFLFFYSLLGVD